MHGPAEDGHGATPGEQETVDQPKQTKHGWRISGEAAIESRSHSAHVTATQSSSRCHSRNEKKPLADRYFVIGTGIAVAARAAGAAVLAAALGLPLSVGTAHAAPGAPQQTSGEGTLYGDPAAAAPFWRYQAYDDDCVEAAVSDVVGELTGHRPLSKPLSRWPNQRPVPSIPGRFTPSPRNTSQPAAPLSMTNRRCSRTTASTP